MCKWRGSVSTSAPASIFNVGWKLYQLHLAIAYIQRIATDEIYTRKQHGHCITEKQEEECPLMT